MKTDLFQSCGHCWVFHICWHIECSTFTASSFRIWNSSAGIPSLPLVLFSQTQCHQESYTSSCVLWHWLCLHPWLTGWKNDWLGSIKDGFQELQLSFWLACNTYKDGSQVLACVCDDILAFSPKINKTVLEGNF